MKQEHINKEALLLHIANHPAPPDGHAYISPSSFHKYLHCPAAASREFLVEKRNEFILDHAAILAEDKEGEAIIKGTLEKDGTAADDGSVCHGIFERMTREYGEAHLPEPPTGDDIVGEIYEDLGSLGASEGIIDDREFVEAFGKVVSQMITVLRASAAWYLNEIRLPLVGYNSFGTADLVMESKDGALYIYDLKTGRQEVNAENNEQLMAYAIGVLDGIGWEKYKKVVFGILGIRFASNVWECGVEKVAEFRDLVLKPGLRKAFAIGNKGCFGEHCLYCKAKLFCPEWFTFVGGEKGEEAFGTEGNEFTELDNETLVSRFLWSKQVERFQTDARNEIALRFEAEGFSKIHEDKRVKYIRPAATVEYKDEKEAIRKIETLGDDIQRNFIVRKPVNPGRLKSLVPEDVYEDLTVLKARKPYVRMA